VSHHEPVGRFGVVTLRGISKELGAGALRGALVGLPVLGIGGRVMMRIIAHWEGRTPVLTSGTVTVVTMGTIAGAIGGIVHALLVRFIRSRIARLVLLEIIGVLFTLYAVRDLLVRPKLLFVGIMVVYVMLLEAVTRTRPRSAA
jgi:hypothetical protein